jgi:putative acetyltransferase
MSVQPGWRSRGVGNALLGSLVAWATSVKEIEKIILRVRADNPRAIALYKKHGFVQCGLSKDVLKLDDGVYVDEVTMERFVR